MKDIVETLPGIEKIRVRFLALLEERQGVIAHHALAAWETTDPDKAQNHLETAQNTLHQIAGSAGSLGFDVLGQAARDCENEIINHLDKPHADGAAVPVGIMNLMDQFVSQSHALLAQYT